MKKFFIILICILSTNLFAVAKIDSLMLDANQLYQDQKFNDAVERYHEIIELGYNSSTLYYNLGNAYYRSGRLGFAILNYERGLKLDPDNEDLLYNLKIVKTRTVDRIKEVPQIFLVDWWISFITALTPATWQIIVIIFYLAFLLGLTFFLVSKNRRFQRFALYSTSITLLGAILFSIILTANVRRETSKDFAIITTNTAAAKQSPNDSSNDLFVIHEGLKVSVTSQFGDWVEIELFDGNVGWLPKDTLEII